MLKNKTLKRIYTLGTSNRSLEEFLELLERFKIRQVFDVRSFPQSKRFPHFSREALKRALEEAGFSYHWLGKELGGYRQGGYEAYLKTEAFREGLRKLASFATKAPGAIVCAERFPWRCHRRFISLALEELGFEVIHIIEKERIWCPHKKYSQLELRFPLSRPIEKPNDRR